MANLIDNGRFERGLDAWARTPERDTHVQVFAGDSTRPGRHCLRFRNKDAYVEQTLEEPATFFWPSHLTFWLRGDPAGHATLKVELDYAGDMDFDWFDCPTDWTLTCYPLRRFRALERVRFISETSNPIYLDDVSLKAWAEPSRFHRGIKRFGEPSFRRAPPEMPFSSAEEVAASSAAAFANSLAMEERLIGIEKRLQQVVAALSQTNPQVKQEKSINLPPLEEERKQA